MQKLILDTDVKTEGASTESPSMQKKIFTWHSESFSLVPVSNQLLNYLNGEQLKSIKKVILQLTKWLHFGRKFPLSEIHKISLKHGVYLIETDKILRCLGRRNMERTFPLRKSLEDSCYLSSCHTLIALLPSRRSYRCLKL